MSDLGRQRGSNGKTPEINNCYEISLDDIAIHIRRMREFASPIFSATIDSIYVEDWTKVMSQNFRALSIPKNLKVTIACMFLRGEPVAWFKPAVQPHLYRWNKFRSFLKRNFGSFGAHWERRMIKEFENCTDNSSDGGFGRDKDVGPSNVPGRDARDYGSNDSDDGDDEKDPEEESDRDKT